MCGEQLLSVIGGNKKTFYPFFYPFFGVDYGYRAVGQTIQEHVYILEVGEKFERLAQTAKFFEMTDGKEGRAG